MGCPLIRQVAANKLADTCPHPLLAVLFNTDPGPQVLALLTFWGWDAALVGDNVFTGPRPDPSGLEPLGLVCTRVKLLSHLPR